MKRLFDVLVVVAVGVLFLVPFCAVALLVRLTSPGPVLYWSDRVGRHNKLFKMPKFRTMRTGAPNVATHLLPDPDAWITPLGRFLRRSSLDELPQLWNVLQGDMSFVGPRPERPEFVNDLQHKIAYYSLRHRVDPGITGWAQVRYGYGSSAEDALQKLQYDLYYVKNNSLFLDFLVLINTLKVVLFRSGR